MNHREIREVNEKEEQNRKQKEYVTQRRKDAKGR